jgi:hypothetical protein
MNYRIFGRLSCICPTPRGFLSPTASALGWRSVLFALLFGTTGNLSSRNGHPGGQLNKREWRWLAQVAILWCLGGGTAAAQLSITEPANGATVSGSTPVTVAFNGGWVNVYLNGVYQFSTPPNVQNIDTTTVPNGGYTLSADQFDDFGNFVANYPVWIHINNSAGGGGSGGGIASTNTISSLNGSASYLGVDTNPSDYGNYPIQWNGFGAMGGPLLNDSDAASKVVPTPQSDAELNAYGTGAANQAADNYFNNEAANNPNDYLNQLSSFYSAYNGGAWMAIQRVDGACPMANPTTAEIVQWAANKWGINPLVLYSVASNEAHWDETAINDHGGGKQDAGLFQVADSGATHAFPGFSGGGANLARENSCFNADFYGAWLWGAYAGQVGSGSGDVGTAIESWSNPSATSSDGYASTIWGLLSNPSGTWESWYFNGQNVPY